MALKLIEEHNLKQEGWSFRLDKATKRFGCCNYTKKEISLSKRLTELNNEEKVEDTILHEIAHALVGPDHGHDRVWKAKAKEIGCNAERCYSDDVVTPQSKYTAICDNCGKTEQVKKISWKKKFSACGVCCKEYNNGQFSWRFRLKFIENSF